MKRLLLNLSVGRKLAASAGLALALLTALVVGSWHATTGIVAEQQAAARTQAASDAMAEGTARLRGIPALERDLLLAQAAGAQDPAKRALLGALDEGLGLATAGAAAFGHGGVAEAAAALATAAGPYRAALLALAAERARLIAARDERLFAPSGEYDQVFEAVTGALALDLPRQAQEEAQQKILTLHAAVNEVRAGVPRLLATGDAAQARRIRRAVAQLRVHARGVAAIEAPAMLAADLRRLAERAVGFGAAAEEVLAAGEAMERIRAEQVAPARDALEGALAGMAAAGAQAAAARRDSAIAQAELVQAGVLLGGAAIALVLVLSGLAVTASVSAPLRRLSAAMARIADGDAAVAVPHRGRRDEIGAIAEALEALRGTVGRAFAQGQMLEQMPTAVMSADPHDGFRITYMNAESLRLLGRVERHLPMPPAALLEQSIDVFHADPAHQRAMLADPARLPHTARIRLGEEAMELRISAIRDAAGGYAGAMLCWQLATEKARLADTFEHEVGAVVEAVAASAERLQASARALSEAAGTSGREAAAVAEAGGRAHADVQSVAAAAEEMAASVAEIARRVGEAAEVANRAVAEARATDGTVQGLSEAASRIGDVVRLIGDIAGQTNLLALNATIEAARAGEAGKGFAVVASEVKSLAGQTARATEEIGRQIAEMQAATSQAVAAIRGIGATVERTSDIATAIAAAVEEQGAATREIARSATQVAEATQVVAGRIAGVRGAAEATGGSAATLQEDSARLAGQASTLRDKAGGFLRAVRAM